jgi:predicted nucleic acid-binding protein
MPAKAIVLDANILIRAVLGTRVRELILDNITTVKFFAPDVAYADSRKHLPPLLRKRGVDANAALVVLDRLETIVQSMDADLYEGMRRQALQRIALRDADDWPVLARRMTMATPLIVIARQ